MPDTMLGIIGGTGVYSMEGVDDAKRHSLDTPWGRPSGEIITGTIGGVGVAFLPRHGEGHVYSPSTVPYRANIASLKMVGVTDIVSVSACGSFREELPPGSFLIVDQYIDRTFAREKSFFGTGCVGHVSFASPTCGRVSQACANAASAVGVAFKHGGTYLAMEGPQFSTLAESRLYREIWGCDVIGMTNMPEAKLAREAEICYAAVAMITDYDCWHPDHGDIDIPAIIATLRANGQNAAKLVRKLPSLLESPREPCEQGCDRALDHAIITAPESRDAERVEKLRVVAGRVLAE
ncbi:MAG: S-methyl-5'-thioadenosine phosphorylase [Albidovulum sp.]|nr:S-methyl-5'-thioadenosine phosphorylase [Albidovulum sp.]MDE0306738.1 S-methyl-5'-thioadenosine phosphorylase [Albidovulum sp.]MDE0532861.1 S-methyl-5'-thioadenosine phosphorylase [Albidovulum sp.]